MIAEGLLLWKGITLVKGILIISGVGVLALAVWPYIAVLFATVVIPGLRKTLGTTVADLTAKLVDWADGKLSLGSSKVLALYRQFKSRVLGVKTVWTVQGATATQDNQTFVIDENGAKVQVVSSVRTVDYTQLPADIRSRYFQSKANSIQSETGDALDKKLAERAKLEGFELTA